MFLAPINDRPRLKDNGAQLHKCEWGNVTYQIALHESSYLFPLLSKNLACRFRDGFCGYTDLTTANETQGATIRGVAQTDASSHTKVTSNGIDQYRGSGPEYGQEAANCQGWPDTPLILRSAEEMNDPEFPDGELWCQPEYYVAADAWRGVDPPPAGCVFCAGEYGLLMTEPVGVYAAGVIDTHVPGGSQRMLRSEAAIELVYSFYYHMWDGDPSCTVKSYHEDMGSSSCRLDPELAETGPQFGRGKGLRRIITRGSTDVLPCLENSCKAGCSCVSVRSDSPTPTASWLSTRFQ